MLKFFTAGVLACALMVPAMAQTPTPVQPTQPTPVVVQPVQPVIQPVPFKTGQDLAKHLQDVSVTIHAGNSQGSGVIKTRNGINYVWTAGHVVAGLREHRVVVDPKTGATKTVIGFNDAKVVKELIEDGRSVGRLEMDAEVLRYSDAENGEDLALLRIRKKGFEAASVKFYLGDTITGSGTELFHCGSLLGQMGSNSVTRGIVSQHGRVIDNKVYDQTTCAAFPGSSGGGVYLSNSGLYCGMIVRGAGETFNLTVPIRRMREYAKRVKIEWAIDDNVAVPDNKTIYSTPVEEVGGDHHVFAKKTDVTINGKKLKFMINIRKEYNIDLLDN